VTRSGLVLVAVLGCGVAFAQDDLAAFWRRGRVRELLLSRLPQDDAALAEWARCGVNCVLGPKPDLAHKHGMRCRTWFTMNAIRPRNFPEETIKAMAAVNRDGSYRRPYDPLFPSVANNWSACVNNPLWREHARKTFRRMAEQGYDGCHIDYASHYEPCCCRHCEARWARWAADHRLDAADLRKVPGDTRHRMSLREFRIRCVMDFLGMCRDEARKLRPGFGTDGTWHQDSGSTYQWAFGDHFDLMCIEGTTWGPFPPRSQQILWLKLAHALSKDKVAMSVTYHLITEDATRRHGRMAGDRARLALCEILSQGAVSWLGLGGPHTGSLLREHQPMVKQVYRTWADLEPQLATRTELGEVAIVFSPRSFLLSGSSRKQLYAIGQALMTAHVPFLVLSDIGLTAKRLSACPATVLLDAAALSPEAMQALERYVEAGGKLLMAGSQPQYDADWRKLAKTPALLTKPEGGKGVVAREVKGRTVWYWLGDALARSALGAGQSAIVNQKEPAPLAIEGESKALAVSGVRDSGYSLYVDITCQDGSKLWGQVATFDTGTHDWQPSRFIIRHTKPVKHARVHLLLRGHAGTAWFRRVRFGPWDAERQCVARNLLGPASRWQPYRGGFELEEIAGEGPTVKVATGAHVVSVGEMHTPHPGATEAVMKHIRPLLPRSRMLTVEGEGSDGVYCDVARVEGGVLLQFLNYNATLHPRLPELEQQKADQSVPVRNLRVRFHPPDGKQLVELTLKVPGAVDRKLDVSDNTFVLPTLAQYAAVIGKVR
jgi:hypothetical protein